MWRRTIYAWIACLWCIRGATRLRWLPAYIRAFTSRWYARDDSAISTTSKSRLGTFDENHDAFMRTAVSIFDVSFSESPRARIGRCFQTRPLPRPGSQSF